MAALIFVSGHSTSITFGYKISFGIGRKEDGLACRTLNILDGSSQKCLAIRVKRKLNSVDVINVPTGLFIIRGVPTCIRSNNGLEFISEYVRQRPSWHHVPAMVRRASRAAAVPPLRLGGKHQ